MGTPVRDLHSNLSSILLIAPASPTSDTTPISVDNRGFGACMIMLYIGIGGITFTTSNKIEFILEHSTDNASWSPVANSDVMGVTVATGGIVRSLTAAKAAADIQEMSYVGGLRYVRLTADFSGTHATGTPMFAAAIRGIPSLSPVV